MVRLSHTQGKSQIGVGSVVNTSHEGDMEERPVEKIVMKHEDNDQGSAKPRIETLMNNPDFLRKG